MTTETIPYVSKIVDVQAKPAKKAKRRRLSAEDMEIVTALEAVQSDMDFLHRCFDETTDETLIDSLIYELKAVQLRYQYYLNLCKARGIAYGKAIPSKTLDALPSAKTDVIGSPDLLPLSAE